MEKIWTSDVWESESGNPMFGMKGRKKEVVRRWMLVEGGVQGALRQLSVSLGAAAGINPG
jgi:hypothetical protein